MQAEASRRAGTGRQLDLPGGLVVAPPEALQTAERRPESQTDPTACGIELIDDHGLAACGSRGLGRAVGLATVNVVQLGWLVGELTAHRRTPAVFVVAAEQLELPGLGGPELGSDGADD